MGGKNETKNIIKCVLFDISEVHEHILNFWLVIWVINNVILIIINNNLIIYMWGQCPFNILAPFLELS